MDLLPGDWNDLQIFRHALKDRLNDGERLVADDIYISEAPQFLKCAGCMLTTEEQLEWHKRVEGRHELGNRHVKFWNCLCKKYKGTGNPMQKMRNHNKMFRACAVIKQVGMEIGMGYLYENDREVYR